MLDLENWFASGERIEVGLSQNDKSKRVNIFCKVEGSGPWLTSLHGFPTCSWDWVRIVDGLKSTYRLLLFDFLGFGDSDKPRGHKYSILEQADITEILWQRFKVDETDVVAHDYGDSVALELLSRQRDGQLSSQINRVVMLNGGIYVDYQKPLLTQRLLLMPILGFIFSRILTERSFKKRFASVFSESHPISNAELGQHWNAINRRAGMRNIHRIIRYLPERKKFKSRWEETLEKTETPIRFLWGLEDPVSGNNISDQILKRNLQANLLEIQNVGHYPQLEVPELVADEILIFICR